MPTPNINILGGKVENKANLILLYIIFVKLLFIFVDLIFKFI